ncbi:CHC2 zinc finger domain-containing protein [Legionella quinlivanii]|uniref:CHC2 zinc finger domain-containing protein n=1 Tax=Legionella quinlivanii TaxID=45073 RepID=UPI00224493FE|nr:CHC2 zinc finger domain-containing protein [Legionella quinlivanii]MCW8452510.1 CHC2 zinc finger domain-containing protein [Legionella quinlivanii]
MNIGRNPQFVGATRAYKKNLGSNFNLKMNGRKFDRSLLPTPAAYYSKQFQTLKIKSEWVKVKCCFHDDSTPSLSINMVSGHFRCFGCGAKGGDVLDFHRLRYKLDFKDAANQLGAWSHE